MTDGERIARLERANRRLWAVVGAAGVAALLGAGRGRVKKLEADRVETRGLLVVDGEGRVRASLTTGEGGTALGIDGPDGRERVLVGVDDEGSSSIHAVQPDGRGASIMSGAGKPAAIELTGPGERLLLRLPARP